jgi:saccharopine dehydrogenase-like NADP-dependent oxidoreductase
MHNIALLGAGLIGRFYAMSLLGYRGKDEIKVVCASSRERAAKVAKDSKINIGRSETRRMAYPPETKMIRAAGF